MRENRWSGSGILLLAVLITMLSIRAGAQVNLRYDQNETVTWQEAITMYQWLDENHKMAKLVEAGLTDAGKPLHLFIISGDGTFDPETINKSGKTVLFINNGIHPGEPCGVDASLKFADELLTGKDEYKRFLENTVVLIVPMFNVGGALNRSATHRANQNGPKEHGFRGNARNLDLNRDFIKMDSRNTQSLVPILRQWNPHIFVDTHTSNGADYPYVITLINSHQQRHEPALADLLDQTLLPFLFEAMDHTPYEMSPYVWSIRRSPENGIIAFMDYPRYTSGYTSLYNTISFTVETHMFKPFSDRVLSTWHLLREMLRFSSIHQKEIREARNKAWQEKMKRQEFTLVWKLDSSRYEMIPFKGYTASSKTGPVTGLPQIYYDRNKPWEKEIPYYRFFSPVVTIDVPDYYILPSAWAEVVERLQLNQVSMKTFQSDTMLEAEVYFIEEFETDSRPYNGHYRHHDVQVRKKLQEVKINAGDFLIPLRQPATEYLVQTLEPTGYDSFFSWNFFDEILFRNEYFSPYIFEETAAEILKENPELKQEFELKKSQDSSFSVSSYAQLRFIYERSPWSEPTYRRYPVFRLKD